MKTNTIIAGGCAGTVTMTPAKGCGFAVTFPEIPNLATAGGTLAGAKAKAMDSVHDYLAALEATRRQPRIEQELREFTDGEPTIPLAVAERRNVSTTVRQPVFKIRLGLRAFGLAD